MSILNIQRRCTTPRRRLAGGPIVTSRPAARAVRRASASRTSAAAMSAREQGGSRPSRKAAPATSGAPLKMSHETGAITAAASAHRAETPWPHCERRGGCHAHMDDIHDEWVTVDAARRTAANWGGWEYLVRWKGGVGTWEPEYSLITSADAELRRAMNDAREFRHRPNSLRELILTSARACNTQARDRARAALRAVQGSTSDDDEMALFSNSCAITHRTWVQAHSHVMT